MEELVSLHLGAKTRLSDVMELEERAIVGRFLGWKMNGESLKEWTKTDFELVVKYHPYIIIWLKDG
jgi:hypothetical protein